MTKKEALAEIARLQKIVDDLDKSIPQPLENPNWESIKQVASAHIEELGKGGFADENFDHWFYEMVMETIYGTGIWEWINERI